MTEEEKELERVRNIALDRMRKQNIYGGEGTYLPLGLLESEMDKVRREELDKAKKLEADRAAVLEENRKKTEAMQRVGLLPKIQPDLSAYAMDIFPLGSVLRQLMITKSLDTRSFHKSALQEY